MSDKSLTLDAAAAIDSYTQQSIAKINDNATRTFHATSAAIDDHLKKARSVAEDMRKKIADKVKVLRNE